MKQRKGDQPLPVRNDAPDIQSQVIADIEARRLVGIERYGTALQPWNGRDALRDLYEELLDAAMYVKQAMVERGNRRSEAEIRALALREASVVARGRGHEEFAQYLAAVAEEIDPVPLAGAPAVRGGLTP